MLAVWTAVKERNIEYQMFSHHQSAVPSECPVQQPRPAFGRDGRTAVCVCASVRPVSLHLNAGDLERVLTSMFVLGKNVLYLETQQHIRSVCLSQMQHLQQRPIYQPADISWFLHPKNMANIKLQTFICEDLWNVKWQRHAVFCIGKRKFRALKWVSLWEAL